MTACVESRLYVDISKLRFQVGLFNLACRVAHLRGSYVSTDGKNKPWRKMGLRPNSWLGPISGGNFPNFEAKTDASLRFAQPLRGTCLVEALPEDRWSPVSHGRRVGSSLLRAKRRGRAEKNMIPFFLQLVGPGSCWGFLANQAEQK